MKLKKVDYFEKNIIYYSDMGYLKIILILFNKKEKIKSIIYCIYSFINSSVELLILASVLPLTQLIISSNSDNFFAIFYLILN